MSVRHACLTNQVEHPFLVSLDYVFQNEFRIYFLMQFVQGGELYKHLCDAKRFSEERARFYAIQVALALGCLHEQNILYRDLKPENILLEKNGYIYLADFGLAKIVENNEQARSFCGTAEYLAPEMVDSKGHNHGVDWWALGVLL